MKRQFLIAELAMLFEKRAAQDRLGRQALWSGFPDAPAAKILGRQPDEFAMLVQPLGHRLNFNSRPIS